MGCRTPHDGDSVVNVIAYTALLYGRDYLASAIRSVIDSIDEYHVIYSPVGAHGHRTDIPCPETRDELYAIAETAAGSKLHWHDAGPFIHEGYQRDSIHACAPDADVILVLDADEIWPDGLAQHIIGQYERQANWHPLVRTLRVSMIHLWRSFHRGILHDPAYPVRAIFPKSQGTMEGGLAWKPIVHMGYAQRSEIVEYKQHTHGHKGEWRKDDWFNSIFMDPDRRTDLHPVGSEYWTAEDINPWQYLPEWMKAHPYATLDLIP